MSEYDIDRETSDLVELIEAHTSIENIGGTTVLMSGSVARLATAAALHRARAEGRREMRERAALRVGEHERERWNGRARTMRQLASDIRALPIDDEVT